MIKIQIKSIVGKLLFEHKGSSKKDVLIEAVSHGADIHGADLYGADLHGADLCGADLHGADLRGADLHGADLRGADLHGADLYGADLRGADLHGADLHGADLHGADLYGADLRGADLHGADLHGAKLKIVYINNPLSILLNQKNKLIAYKYLKNDMISPYQNVKYEIGKQYVEKDYNKSLLDTCGKGLNVATLEWCIKDVGCNTENFKFIEVEFSPKDIVVIPYNSDGKFRVKKLKVIREVPKSHINKLLKNI